MFPITNKAAFDIWINTDIKMLIAVFATGCEYICVSYLHSCMCAKGIKLDNTASRE